MTPEENDLLCRVEGDAPMKAIMRRHWIAACLAEEVAEPDGKPLRVKLLGEPLVVFRDSKGRLGVLDEYCAHRRASLFYGRNDAAPHPQLAQSAPAHPAETKPPEHKAADAVAEPAGSGPALSTDVLKRKVDESMPALQGCVDEALQRDPALRVGRVLILATVAPTGAVTSTAGPSW